MEFGASFRTGRVTLLVFSALLCSCQRPAATLAAKTAAAGGQVAALPPQRQVDDAARFLAGLPGKPGSDFLELESDSAWKEHERQMDAAWANAEEQLLRGLRQFQKSELSTAPLAEAPVWYPFSGPDALIMTTCFPRSRVYVMMALEPAGTLPTVEQMRNKPLGPYLAAIRETVASELGRSFFVTREMDRQFRGQVTDGLLVPILQLLVRTGHTVLGFRYVRVDEQGRVVERPGGVPVQAPIANKGLDLEFRTDSDQSIHRLYYFTVNLSNSRLGKNQGVLEYISHIQGATSMLKATSYMTHKPEFSMIRDLVLAHSAAVMEDDSGVPFHCFTANTWKLQLYGDYYQPYGSFKWLEQADLRKAYQAGGAKPLSMHMGYGFRRITSNLLLARRLDLAP